MENSLLVLVQDILLVRYGEHNTNMGRPKKIEKTKTPKEKLEFDKILGECHDGEDYKLLMKDGSVKIVVKAEVDEK